MLSYIQFKSFIVLCDTGSFSKAADVLSTTQPTMTKRIQQIENNIGKSLLSRQSSTNEFALTEHGEIFLQHAKQIVESYELLNETFIKSPPLNDDMTVINLSTLRGIFYMFLSDKVKEIVSTYPNVQIKSELYGSNILRELLKTGQADIVFLVGDCSDEDTISDFYVHHDMSWYANNDLYHRIVKFKTIHEVYKEITIITCHEHLAPVHIMEKAFKSNNIKDFTMQYSSSMDIMFDLVVQGFGIGFFPKQYIEWYNDKREDKLIELDLLHIEEGLDIYSAILKNNDKKKYYDLLRS